MPMKANNPFGVKKEPEEDAFVKNMRTGTAKPASKPIPQIEAKKEIVAEKKETAQVTDKKEAAKVMEKKEAPVVTKVSNNPFGAPKEAKPMLRR